MSREVCGRCGGRGKVYVPNWSGTDVDVDDCPSCQGSGLPPLPALPYAGTSGHAGSDTSRERAEREDSDGTTTERQREVLAALDESGVFGLTWKDLAERFGWHHGQASGVLSVLHKAGLVARLTDRRNRCKVYVLPDRVIGRASEQPGRTKSSTCPNCGCSLGGAA